MLLLLVCESDQIKEYSLDQVLVDNPTLLRTDELYDAESKFTD